ncbi:MAG: hypothetical protein WKG00_27330 [Polyangiaceae bacterium]
MRSMFLLAFLVAVPGCGEDVSGVGSSGEGASSSSGAPSAGGAGGDASTGGVPVGSASAGGAASGGAGGGAAACASDLPVVSFAADIQPIFTQSCALTNCHRGSQPDVGLDLSDGKAHAEIFGVATAECSGARTRVIPGDPDESYLLDKVLGVDLCNKSSRMPINSPKLSEAKLAVLHAWICAGALDD